MQDERDGTTSGPPWVWRIPFMSARRKAQGGGGTLCLTSAPCDISTPEERSPLSQAGGDQSVATRGALPEGAGAPSTDPGSPSDAR